MTKNDILKLFPIETDRLILRLATVDDAHLIQSAKESHHPDTLRRWMSWSSEEGMSMQATLDYLTMATSQDNTRCIAILGIDKTTHTHVLSTGFDAEDDDFNVVSTGWWLSDGHEGKGLAFEGMSSLLDLCRQNRLCQKVISDHFEGNQRSQNLMNRLGFQYVETKTKSHQCHLDGAFHDVLHYEVSINDV